MPEYTVRQGDCISSIAERYGLVWEQVWNHPNNAGLKARRKDPNVLCPGDVVYVSELTIKEEDAATDQRHRFIRKGVPAKLRLRLLDEDEPICNERYILEIDGRSFSGTTDSEGRLQHPIPPDARRGRLLIGDEQEEVVLDLGHIDPIGEVSGIQGRLHNLGYDCGPVDGVLGPRTRAAIREFQEAMELEETGEADGDTVRRVEQEYGA